MYIVVVVISPVPQNVFAFAENIPGYDGSGDRGAGEKLIFIYKELKSSLCSVIFYSTN